MAQAIPDRGPALRRAMIVLIVLCDTSVLLRFVSRKIAKSRFGYDDYMAVAAMLLANACAICVLTAVSFDFGKHVGDARHDAVSKWYTVLYVYENFYTSAIATTKLSVLLFYHRLFSTGSFRIALYTIGAVVMMWWIAIQFAVIFACTPIDYTWNPHGEGRCIDLDKFFFGQAIPNITTDLVLLAIPIPMIWRLHLPRSQKLALNGIFMLGGFIVFASIYRLVLLIEQSPIAEDITWTYFGVVMWSAVEPNVGVISACLPSYRPILKICGRSITSLKVSTQSLSLGYRKAIDSNNDQDSIRIVGPERHLNANPSIELEELGVRTKIEKGERKRECEPNVPLTAVHVRKDFTIRSGQH